MRILQVVHGFPPTASGGTEVYVRDLSTALSAARNDDVAVFTRHGDFNARDLGIKRSVDHRIEIFSVNNTFSSCDSFESSYANPPIECIAGEVLHDWKPDIVHVQHLTCLSTGIPRQALRRGIPVIMTLNDYWLICHRGQLVDIDGQRCAGPIGNGCGRCLPPAALVNRAAFQSGRALRSLSIPGVPSMIDVATRAWTTAMPADRVRAATVDRLAHMRAAVADVAVFLAPSDILASTYVSCGFPAERIIRCNQGIDISPFKRIRRAPSPMLRIGFAGGLLPTKGIDILLDAIERLPRQSVSLDLFGGTVGYHGERQFADAMRMRLGHPAVRRFGPVAHERMPEVLADIDVMVVPSIWIENAPFIIREAFAAGLPVVASNLGGMAEMVRHGVDGLLFPVGDSGALTAILRRLLDEPTLLDTLRSGIVQPMAIQDDARWLRRLYERIGARETTTRVAAASHQGSYTRCVPELSALVLNYRTPDQTALTVRSLQTSMLRPGETLVVDNHSGDGSVDPLRRALDDVCVIEAGANLGFSGGCNVGIRAAIEKGARFVLLVNSDAILAPDTIGHLLAAMERNPQLGIVAPVVLSREEPDHVSTAGISFSVRTGRMRHRAAGRRLAAIGSNPVHVVDAVSGCVMLIRREVFDRIGLLDEAYFFSFEDVDFCLRARDAGFTTACVQDARAYHEGGRTIGRRSPRRVYFGTRNHLRLAARTGRTATRPMRFALVAAFNAAYVLVSPESPLIGGSAAFVRGVWHHLIGRYGAG
jgi:GT2 family glycosyltransferase/glycosyltransferase involved in cell wall biosynthesis